MFAFLTEAGLRRKYRRLVLGALAAFVVVSAAMHVTIGSILAALWPSQGPAADPAITIVTLSRAQSQQPTILTITHSDVALRDLTNPRPASQAPTLRREPASSVAAASTSEAFVSVLSPSSPSVSPSRGGRTARKAGPASVAEVSAAGDQPQWQSGGDGQNADAFGSGRSAIGQMPSGAVFAQGGPAGQDEGTGGGIELGGGSAPMRFPPPVHDSCSPPRGEFF